MFLIVGSCTNGLACRLFKLCYSALLCQVMLAALFSNLALRLKEGISRSLVHKLGKPRQSPCIICSFFFFFMHATSSSDALIIQSRFCAHTHSFWIPVQRQVRLQHRAAPLEQATRRCGERGGHDFPPRRRPRADGQLHRTGLHHRGHGHLSGTVRKKKKRGEKKGRTFSLIMQVMTEAVAHAGPLT